MIFKRHAEIYLHKWKKNPASKPLILRGARQVGKTTLIKEFSKTYQNKILLNLEKPSDKAFFEKYHEPKIFIESVFFINNLSISTHKNTLLFIDEIQESPEAIQMLRYFHEEYPKLHVIAAGSLLEFSMKGIKSFPVGRVEYLYIYPLNFQEYLEAIGHQEASNQLNKIPNDDFVYDTLNRLFKQYAIIGGMPEIIKTYIEKESITELPRIYESIWSTYKNDVIKYSSNKTEKKIIKYIMSTAHLYIDQRIKYQNFGKSNYRSREVGEAIRNLNDAKVIQLIHPTTDIEIPLKPDLRKSPRLQFLDTGIINYELGIQAEMLSFDDLNKAYKGAIIPHLVTQELISLNYLKDKKPHFWIREKKQSSAEVDLVYNYKRLAIPIEIKSGKEGTLKSLHQFINQSKHPYAIRMYSGDFMVKREKTPAGVPYILMNLPYCLGTKIPEYIEFLVENYKL
jgi:predicted AAA+ superfamily ATPase